MRIGDMYRRINIEQPTRVTDSYGDLNNEVTWNIKYRLRASRTMLRADEQVAAQRINMVQTYNYFTHYRPGVTSAMRVHDIDEGKYYAIVGVEEINRRQMLKIAVKLYE